MTHEPMATTVLTHNHHDEKNDGKTNSVVANVRWTRTHILRLDGRWLIYVDVTSRFIYLLFFFFAFFSFDAIASVPHSTTTTSTTKPWQIYTHNVNDNQHIRLISSYNACRANCIIWILCSTVFGAHCMSVAHWMRAFVVQKRDRDDSNVVQFKNRWRREIFNVSNANAVQLLLNAFNQFGGSLNSMPSFHRQNYGRTKKNAKLRHREMNKPKKIQKKKIKWFICKWWKSWLCAVTTKTESTMIRSHFPAISSRRRVSDGLRSTQIERIESTIQ